MHATHVITIKIEELLWLKVIIFEVPGTTPKFMISTYQ